MMSSSEKYRAGEKARVGCSPIVKFLIVLGAPLSLIWVAGMGATMSSLAANTHMDMGNVVVDHRTLESGGHDNGSKNDSNNTTLQEVHININAHLHGSHIGEHETILTMAMPMFLKEDGQLVPPGAVIDAGAQFGEQAAHYAASAPDRIVYALDPSPSNVASIEQKYGALPNLKILQGGLGEREGVSKPHKEGFNMADGDEFPLFTLDSIFFDKGVKLGLAHLDVEGLELQVLKGGVKTLRENKPLFTTEVRIHEDPNYTRDLLIFIDEMGYDSWVVNEVCGYPHMDFRNILNIPRAKSGNHALHSDTLQLLYATDSIFRVPTPGKEDIHNKTSVFDLVLPCCALGGDCCPFTDIKHKDCCSEKLVANYHANKKPEPFLEIYGWKSARKRFLTLYYRIKQREKVRPH